MHFADCKVHVLMPSIKDGVKQVCIDENGPFRSRRSLRKHYQIRPRVKKSVLNYHFRSTLLATPAHIYGFYTVKPILYNG